MLANRYIYWLIFLNMMANVVAYVPRILLQEQYSGVVMAIFIAIIGGTALIYWGNYIFSLFPGKGGAEILEQQLPFWFRFGYVFLNGCIWFLAGLITLLVFTDIAKLFINPDMSSLFIILLFSISVGYGALSESKIVLFILEIILIFSLPFMIFVFWKAYTNHYFSWDAVRIVLTHYQELPSWSTISAAFYIFLGFFNVFIFNRVTSPLKKRWMWLIPCSGGISLFTTVMVPVGLNGTVMVKQYTYPWITTADALQMSFGMVERILFIFLLINVIISLSSAMVHWHVGIEWFKSILPPLQKNGVSYLPVLIVSLFVAISACTIFLIDENQLFVFSEIWLSTTVPAILLSNILLTWIAWRQAK